MCSWIAQQDDLMSFLKRLLRDSVPHGLVDLRRRLFRLGRIGLRPPPFRSRACEAAVDACRFELWPSFLRKTNDWMLVDVGANQGDFIRAATLLKQLSAVI